MLPTELLMFRVKAGLVEPRRLKPTTNHLKLAETLIATFEAHVGRKRAELNEELQALEAGRSDYRVVRGLAHLLAQRGEFEAGGTLAPAAVREKVFALAQGASAQPAPDERHAGTGGPRRCPATRRCTPRTWRRPCTPTCRISRR